MYSSMWLSTNFLSLHLLNMDKGQMILCLVYLVINFIKTWIKFTFLVFYAIYADFLMHKINLFYNKKSIYQYFTFVFCHWSFNLINLIFIFIVFIEQRIVSRSKVISKTRKRREAELVDNESLCFKQNPRTETSSSSLHLHVKVNCSSKENGQKTNDCVVYQYQYLDSYILPLIIVSVLIFKLHMYVDSN